MRNHILRTALSITVVATTMSAHAYMPTGSFLRKPCKNIGELVNHVQSDSVVMERFERLFRMRPSEIVSYFGSLHLAKIAHDGSYTIYNVHPDNVIRARVFQLKAGTLVFADANHRPILRQSCGNPMVFEVPPMGSNPGTTTTEVLRDVEMTTDSVENPTSAEPAVGPIPPEDTPPSVLAPIPPTNNTVITRGGGSSALIPLLLVAGGIGLIAATSHHDHHDTPPVPEPATLLILGGGAAAMIRRRKQKQAN